MVEALDCTKRKWFEPTISTYAMMMGVIIQPT